MTPQPTGPEVSLADGEGGPRAEDDAGPSRDEDDAGPSRDEVFTALSNARRRNVIKYLKRNGSEARVRDIAEQLAAWENDVGINEVTYKQRKRVYTALHQSHLPKLSDSGFIDYEADRGLVSLTEDSRQLEMYLEVVSENDILWSEYYVGLAVVCGLLAAAAWAGTVPFDAVSGYAYAVLFAGIFGVSGLLHRLSTKRNRLG
ncbi:hypothetical protein EXE43_12610 [Halorubrum sp. SS5]|nr:hypothetical protein EXE43_12610 [Halorubrum sp. SS5]